MLNSMNIQGRLTKDSELRYTANNKAVASFTIANDVGFGDNKQTSFLNVVAWGKTAEAVSKYTRLGL